MAPSRVQKTNRASTSADPGDDGGFQRKQSNLYRDEVKVRQNEARARIVKTHVDKQKDLQKRIKALKRSTWTQSPANDIADDVPSHSDHTAFRVLRDLLDRKMEIERRIAESIDNLERATRTTSGELAAVLNARAELLATAGASTALVVKP